MKTITLSSASQKLLQEKILLALPQDDTLKKWHENPEAVSRKELINWLAKDHSVDKKFRFFLASFYASLLKDLNDKLSLEQGIEIQPESPKPWYRKGQFFALALAGTLLAMCDGFNGLSSMLGLMATVSPAVLIGTGLLFSAMSVSVFYGFDLAGISKNLGVGFKSTPKLLDVFLEQSAEIKKLRKYIDANFYKADKARFIEMQAMIKMITHRYHALDTARETYNQASNNPALNKLKFGMALITGTLFFSGGFFTGQAMAMTIAELLLGAVAATFTPVLALSILGGAAAFGLYWSLQRPGLENLVSSSFGLDQEKIEEFADEQRVNKQKKKLSGVKDKLSKLAGETESRNERPNHNKERNSSDAVSLTRVNTKDRETQTTGKIRFFNESCLNSAQHMDTEPTQYATP